MQLACVSSPITALQHGNQLHQDTLCTYNSITFQTVRLEVSILNSLIGHKHIFSRISSSSHKMYNTVQYMLGEEKNGIIYCTTCLKTETTGHVCMYTSHLQLKNLEFPPPYPQSWHKYAQVSIRITLHLTAITGEQTRYTTVQYTM